MSDLPIETLKTACALIETPGGKGTGYLVRPDRLATCHHVIESVGLAGEVQVKFENKTFTGRVMALEKETDCAIISVDTPVSDLTPLRLASGCDGRALWSGYGFPAIANHAGLPLDGVVLDPKSMDNLSRPMMTLYSDMVAAGMAAPIHGYSGSPVLVDGVVVGHISKILSMPGAEGRPALGVIYAARASSVLALLGDSAPELMITPETIPRLSEIVPPIGPAEYHVFISYRSTDHNWALALLGRLEAVGFRAFLDQREIIPGDLFANKLQSALDRSRSAVVLISRGWLQSAWCQEEANALLARANNEPDFRVIPVLLEEISVPAFWKGRHRVDFAGIGAPEGARLRQLMYAIVGRTPPAQDSATNQVQSAVTTVTDRAIRGILSQDTPLDPTQALGLVRLWEDAHLPKGAPALGVAERLIAAGHLPSALQILDGAEDSVRAKQLMGLALSKLERWEEAEDILEPLFIEGNIDPESAGILAGDYKRRWLRTGERGYLLKSYETYRETFERTQNPYNGINVATLALFLGKRDESRLVARQVLDLLGQQQQARLRYWDLATIGEAYLLLEDLGKSREWYAKAAAKAYPRDQDVAVMRRQARMVLKELGRDQHALDEDLPVARVVAFSGHMTDAPGRALPRFPESKAGEVKNEIRKSLVAHGGRVHSFSSAARGADLLFLEEVLSLGGSAKVFLPFPPEEFKRVSVGKGWNERFDLVLANPKVEKSLLAQHAPPEADQPEAFEDCNRALLAAAGKQATLLDDDQPLLLTVWDGSLGDGTGGTAHAVAEWISDGHLTENIDISKIP
jgi:tetratricopeptide (TPR) repeat protein